MAHGGSGAKDQRANDSAVRQPVAAGSFYPADRDGLIRELGWCFRHPLGPRAAGEDVTLGSAPVAVVSPHAGIRYSGPIAANAFHGIGHPEVAILVGPNHYGRGAAVAASPHEAWRTPLGDTPVDTDLLGAITDEFPRLKRDAAAQEMEHSLELQLIFLQHVLGNRLRIVPIVMRDHSPTTAAALGHALAAAIRARPAILVASTDLSHYEPDKVARERDILAIEAMERLDVQALADRLTRDESQLCGPGPVMAIMAAARELGASSARLLRYATSGDTGGDYSAVVGYCALRIDAD